MCRFGVGVFCVWRTAGDGATCDKSNTVQEDNRARRKGAGGVYMSNKHWGELNPPQRTWELWCKGG